MSTNTLLLSLLANSSANPRSTSLMLKNTISNPYSSVARSSSISHTQKIVKAKKQADQQHNVSLVRLNHMLNLKLKNHYYFFFCKLEQNIKKFKKEDKSNISVPINQKIQNKQMNPCTQQSTKDILKSKQSERLKRMSGFCDTVTAVMSKRQILLEKQRTEYAYNRIKGHSKTIEVFSFITNLIQKHNNNRLRFAFNAFHKLEKEKMRNQILQISLNQIISKYVSLTFQTIKRYAYHQKQTVLARRNSENQSNVLALLKEEDANLASCEKANRGKKIVLKQKKVGITNPISLPNSKCKISFREQKCLQVSKQIVDDKKMGISLNLKQDMRVDCLADLSDNCFLFGELQVQMPSYTINTAITIQNFSTQGEVDKKISYTERTRRKSIELKPTPKNSRDHYAPVSMSKKLQNQSPLNKIDQILNRIQQLKNSKSDKSREKKTVNINLSKEIYKVNQPSIIKYRKNGVNKQEKQNMPQRLITERQVNSKGKTSGFGFQSATKYKSTMLQKGRDKEGQISTARKMKMEIENIINRRNKQLYKAQSAQLN